MSSLGVSFSVIIFLCHTVQQTKKIQSDISSVILKRPESNAATRDLTFDSPQNSAFCGLLQQESEIYRKAADMASLYTMKATFTKQQ